MAAKAEVEENDWPRSSLPDIRNGNSLSNYIIEKEINEKIETVPFLLPQPPPHPKFFVNLDFSPAELLLAPPHARCVTQSVDWSGRRHYLMKVKLPVPYLQSSSFSSIRFISSPHVFTVRSIKLDLQPRRPTSRVVIIKINFQKLVQRRIKVVSWLSHLQRAGQGEQTARQTTLLVEENKSDEERTGPTYI